MAETQAQKRARLAKRRKGGIGKVFNDMFTTKSQAAENKGFKNLQGTINKASAIAASKGKPKQGPQKQQGGSRFSDEVAASNASISSKPRTKSTATRAEVKSIDLKAKKTKKSSKTGLPENISSKDIAKKAKEVSPKRAKQLERLGRIQDRAERRQQRKDNRTERLAARKNTTFGEARELQNKRRDNRKQYLRNFASQLSRAEQADPKRGFGEGGPAIGVDLAKKAEQEQQSSDAAAIKSSVEVPTEKNKDLGKSFGTMTGTNGGAFSDFLNYNPGKIETPDLSPSAFMKKEYIKKRGF